MPYTRSDPVSAQFHGRYEEIDLIGARHYEAEDLKKGALSQSARSKKRKESAMKEASDYRAAEFGPMKNKTFAGALSAFFEKECPHLGGERIRKVLVQAIVDIVDRFYPRTTHLRPGQTPWITVDRNESSAYGKKMTETKMTSVILDLVTPQDADDRINGKRTRQTRKEALGRLCKQAYEQGGCLTTSELCILLKAPQHRGHPAHPRVAGRERGSPAYAAEPSTTSAPA